MLVPSISRRSPAADVDCEDRQLVFIEDDPVGADPQPVAVSAGKLFHVSPTFDGVERQRVIDRVPSLRGEGVQTPSGALGEDNRFHSDNIATPRAERKR